MISSRFAHLNKALNSFKSRLAKRQFSWRLVADHNRIQTTENMVQKSEQFSQILYKFGVVLKNTVAVKLFSKRHEEITI